jgi:hypothetical protein
MRHANLADGAELQRWPARPLDPLIIIGAPRSGTNMLRDALAAVPGLATWPCDEINYIWRHGNLRYSSDEFPKELARPEVRSFIRARFHRLAMRAGASHVVEKTCANSLRIGFIEAIVPEARYIHIRRNPIDAIASAFKRWRAPLSLSYVMRKARFVPPSDVAYYALRYGANRLHKLTSAERHLATWGPRFNGMDAMLHRATLLEVCTHQWQRCAQSAERALRVLGAERSCEVDYEEFVSRPREELQRILGFLGVPADGITIAAAVMSVAPTEVGKGQHELTETELGIVRRVLGDH